MDAESLEMLARSSCTAHPQSFGGAPAESSCKHEHSHIVDSKPMAVRLRRSGEPTDLL